MAVEPTTAPRGGKGKPPRRRAGDPGSGEFVRLQDEERAYYGIEYLVIGLVFVVGFLLFKSRVVNLLEVVYHPFFILLILVMAAEYIVLKARDRTYILERELEHLRVVREQQRLLIAEAEEDVAALSDALDLVPETPAARGEALATTKAALDDLADRLADHE